MQSKCEIQAGICGFCTRARAHCEDSQHVRLEITSDCQKILTLGRRLEDQGALDAYTEIDSRTESVLLTSAREVLTGCCAGCAVPVGLFKAMQVAAGLALSKDITIKLETSND